MADASEWIVAGAATEHTGEPQLADNECTYNASNATEHADSASRPKDCWALCAEVPLQIMPLCSFTNTGNA